MVKRQKKPSEFSWQEEDDEEKTTKATDGKLVFQKNAPERPTLYTIRMGFAKAFFKNFSKC